MLESCVLYEVDAAEAEDRLCQDKCDFTLEQRDTFE